MWQAPLGNISLFRHSNCIVLASALQTVCAKMNNGLREEWIFLLITWFRIWLPNVNLKVVVICEYCRNKSRHWKIVLSQPVSITGLTVQKILCHNFSSLYSYVGAVWHSARPFVTPLNNLLRWHILCLTLTAAHTWVYFTLTPTFLHNTGFCYLFFYVYLW